MPKVSVIVPIYNTSEYVEKCLDSLVNQTLKDIEIIVVNDGSTDDSAEKIKPYLEKYKNIVYVEKTNGGLSDSRNAGLEKASGKYVAFVDSDDYVDLTMYETMYEKAESESLDLVECDFYWVYPNKQVEDKGFRYKTKREMFVHARVMACNKLIRKDIIKEKFPLALHYEDVEFFYKLLPRIKTFGHVEKPFYYYIQRANSIANKQDYRTGQIFTILNNTVDYYKKNNLYDEYKDELEYSYTRIMLCSSLKRMVKVDDQVARKRLLKETWTNLNTKFPNWKKNKYLKEKSGKNLYMRTVNSFTYKIWCKVL